MNQRSRAKVPRKRAARRLAPARLGAAKRFLVPEPATEPAPTPAAPARSDFWELWTVADLAPARTPNARSRRRAVPSTMRLSTSVWKLWLALLERRLSSRMFCSSPHHFPSHKNSCRKLCRCRQTLQFTVPPLSQAVSSNFARSGTLHRRAVRTPTRCGMPHRLVLTKRGRTTRPNQPLQPTLGFSRETRQSKRCTGGKRCRPVKSRLTLILVPRFHRRFPRFLGGPCDLGFAVFES